MIISHKYKLVFIHIPKTGGSYVKTLLNQIDDECVEILNFNDTQYYGHLPFLIIK